MEIKDLKEIKKNNLESWKKSNKKLMNNVVAGIIIGFGLLAISMVRLPAPVPETFNGSSTELSKTVAIVSQYGDALIAIVGTMALVLGTGFVLMNIFQFGKVSKDSDKIAQSEKSLKEMKDKQND